MKRPKRLPRPKGTGRRRPARKAWPPAELRLPGLATLERIDRGEPVEPEPRSQRQLLLPLGGRLEQALRTESYAGSNISVDK